MISGPSASGKTTFCTKLFSHLNQMFLCTTHSESLIDKEELSPVKFDHVFLIFRNNQPAYEEMKKVLRFQGIPLTLLKMEEGTNEELEKKSSEVENQIEVLNASSSSSTTRAKHFFLLFDDVFLLRSSVLTDWFTRLSHHLSVSTILISQNIFDKRNPFLRTISLNSNYIVAFKNPRDKTQISFLSRQIFPAREKNREFLKFFEEYLNIEPYSYLVFDLHQESKDHLRVWFNLFGEKEPYFQQVFSL